MFELAEVINPVIGLMVNVSVHILSYRYISRLGLLRAIFIGFGAGAMSVLFLQYYIYLNQPLSVYGFFPALFANITIYILLGYGYFHFVNLGETARRIRIVREIYDNPAGLSLQEILKRYDSRKMVEKRINRLVNSEQIIFKDGRYYIGRSFLLISAKIIVMMKLIIIGKRSEFD